MSGGRVNNNGAFALAEGHRLYRRRVRQAEENHIGAVNCLFAGRNILALFLIKPDNLSVLSEEGVRGRVTALTHLLCAMPELRILALDSRESFQRNQEWYRQRLEQEELPALRELLRQDSAHLDEIQTTTASAREFVLVFRLDQQSGESDEVQLRQMEKRIRDQGFHVRLAEEQDVKRLLSVYYQQDVTTDRFEDCDGERGVMDRG